MFQGRLYSLQRFRAPITMWRINFTWTTVRCWWDKIIDNRTFCRCIVIMFYLRVCIWIWGYERLGNRRYAIWRRRRRDGVNCRQRGEFIVYWVRYIDLVCGKWWDLGYRNRRHRMIRIYLHMTSRKAEQWCLSSFYVTEISWWSRIRLGNRIVWTEVKTEKGSTNSYEITQFKYVKAIREKWTNNQKM